MPTSNHRQQYILWLSLFLCNHAASAPPPVVAGVARDDPLATGNQLAKVALPLDNFGANQSDDGGNNANEDSQGWLDGWGPVFIVAAGMFALMFGVAWLLEARRNRRSDVAGHEPLDPQEGAEAPLLCPCCRRDEEFKDWLEEGAWRREQDKQGFCPIAQSDVGDAVLLPCCSRHAGKVGLDEMWLRNRTGLQAARRLPGC